MFSETNYERSRSATTEGDVTGSKNLNKIENVVEQVEEVSKANGVPIDNGAIQETSSTDSELPKEWRYVMKHSKKDMLTDPFGKMVTRSGLRKMMGNVAFISQIEPKMYKKVQDDENWMLAMQEELDKFERCLEACAQADKIVGYWMCFQK